MRVESTKLKSVEERTQYVILSRVPNTILFISPQTRMGRSWFEGIFETIIEHNADLCMS